MYSIEIDNKEIIIKDASSRYTIDLRKRLFHFSIETFKILKYIPNQREYDVFRYQLSKSSTSIGANYEESQAASYNEFGQKIQICLREARETHYWLRLLKEIVNTNDDIFNKKIDHSIQEINEITLILGAISSKVKDKKRQQHEKK